MLNPDTFPQDNAGRAIAGVFEEGFTEGWGPLVPGAPSYRIMTPSGTSCRLRSNFEEQDVILQIQLFGHIEHPPLPVLHIDCGSSSWEWEVEPGWQVLCRSIPVPGDVVEIDFRILNAGEEPWFELQVTEISLLEAGDSRIRCRDRQLS